MKLDADERKILILIVIAFLVLASVHVLRYFLNDGILYGDENYYYLRTAQSIKDNFSFVDKITERPIYDFGLPFILFILSFIFRVNVGIFVIILPIIIGLLSILIFYFILKEFGIGGKIRFFTCLLLIFTPPFIYLYTSANNYFMPIFLMLLAFYYFLKEKMKKAVVFLVLSSFFGLFTVLLMLFLSIIGVIFRYRKKFFISLYYFGIVFLVYSLSRLFFWIKYGLPQRINFNVLGNEILFRHMFSDFGGLMGISIFTLLLAVFGFVVTWREKKKYGLLYINILFLFILFFTRPFISFYLNFFLIVLVVYGFVYIVYAKWESELISRMTIAVLVLAILFSSFFYIKVLYSLEPNKQIMHGLEFLKEEDDGVVFTHYSMGNLLETISGKSALLDSNFVYNNGVNIKWKDSNTLFYTKDINIATQIIDKYDIKYIVIDKKMMKGLVWERKDEGLLFLLKYTTTKFKKLYDNNEIEIWEYT